MISLRRLRWCANVITAVSALILSLPAASQWKDWDYDLDQEKKSWEEMQTKLPPYPKPETLLKLDVGGSANNFFVDGASLTVGDDGVVRYALMVKTTGGATNVSFEGIRCDTRELRVYAFGRPNGEWSRARNTGWRYIEFRDVNNYHLTLFREHFCPTRNTIATVPQIIRTLKQRGPLGTSTD